MAMGLKWLRLALAGLLPLVGGSVQAAPAPKAARPAMWKVADADTIVYLFGTIHLLPKGQGWRTETMDEALSGADELVLEVADIEDVMASATAMAKLGFSPGLPPIAERVPEGKRDALRAMIAESGYPEAVFDKMETWAAALPLLGVTFKRLGLDSSLGVETQIGTPFRKSGKVVTGLETVEQQLGYFDTLSEDAQRALLLSVVEESADTKAQFAQMLAAWASGDLKGISRTFDDETQMSPELRAALMSRRNAAWADWLAKRMEKPGTVFVAVGAGHLAGENSVQKMLKRKGIKAKRVQ